MDLNKFCFNLEDKFYEFSNDEKKLFALGYMKCKTWGPVESQDLGLEKWIKYKKKENDDEFPQREFTFYLLITPEYPFPIKFDSDIEEWQFLVTYLDNVKRL